MKGESWSRCCGSWTQKTISPAHSGTDPNATVSDRFTLTRFPLVSVPVCPCLFSTFSFEILPIRPIFTRKAEASEWISWFPDSVVPSRSKLPLLQSVLGPEAIPPLASWRDPAESCAIMHWPSEKLHRRIELATHRQMQDNL